MIAQTSSPTLTVGDAAPAFKVSTWLKGDSTKGVERGKITIVEFWATWCGPCLANIPHLSRVASEYKDKNVNVFAISVKERNTTDADSLRRFIKGPKGQSMHYNVGADDAEQYMAKNWLAPVGQGGIPFAMVIDQQGKIAWMGHPAIIDSPLAKIVSGRWDISTALSDLKNSKRVAKIDNDMIPRLNDLAAKKDYNEMLRVVDSALAKEPSLIKQFATPHFKFLGLLHTDPEASVTFARNLWATVDFPDWKSVSDIVWYEVDKKKSHYLHQFIYWQPMLCRLRSIIIPGA
ncbi:TlpA family protein disulfide reductase [Pinibacter soli]|uniref:TlpA disulfide reductase family protein n=1 Tax=Pinibacter soli TaxID=3044211 RepID=A0ABT6REN2_9BACT|nr:TlpA disulfide reductase family protein [Pinibacter soli]MDI3320983.1 TlpA disulfide reductase family protein [Pinibacter soli]